MLDKAPAPISLGADMPQGEEFLYQASVAFPALGFRKFEELLHCEIPRMRCHKVEETGLHFGVTEGTKWGGLGFLDAHGSQAVDRCCQFSLVADAPQSAGFL